VILIASGSEVQLCVTVYEALKREGIAARVVSMPSWELFERQDEGYRNAVLPPNVTARVAVEMGAVIGWDRYAGPTGTILGMHSFGASGPIGDVLRKFGFVPDKVCRPPKPRSQGIPRNESFEGGCRTTARPCGSIFWRAASPPRAA